MKTLRINEYAAAYNISTTTISKYIRQKKIRVLLAAKKELIIDDRFKEPVYICVPRFVYERLYKITAAKLNRLIKRGDIHTRTISNYVNLIVSEREFLLKIKDFNVFSLEEYADMKGLSPFSIMKMTKAQKVMYYRCIKCKIIADENYVFHEAVEKIEPKRINAADRMLATEMEKLTPESKNPKLYSQFMNAISNSKTLRNCIGQLTFEMFMQRNAEIKSIMRDENANLLTIVDFIAAKTHQKSIVKSIDMHFKKLRYFNR